MRFIGFQMSHAHASEFFESFVDIPYSDSVTKKESAFEISNYCTNERVTKGGEEEKIAKSRFLFFCM